MALGCLLYACFLWISHALFGVGEIPIHAHANIFIGGFLYLTIMGFFLTEIPRITKSHNLSLTESIISLLLLFTLFVTLLLHLESCFWLVHTAGWMALFLFCWRRGVLQKTSIPSAAAQGSVILMAAFMGFLGSLLHFLELQNFNFISSFNDVEIWKELFFHEGVTHTLMLGAANFLSPLTVLISFLVLVTSFILEGMQWELVADVIRALLFSVVSFRMLQRKIEIIYKVAAVFFLVSLWSQCLLPDYQIHLKHLSYIGVFVLVAWLGSIKKTYPLSGVATKVIGGLVLFASLTRATAFLLPSGYTRHLGYAAVVLFMALIVYVGVILKSLFKLRK